MKMSNGAFESKLTGGTFGLRPEGCIDLTNVPTGTWEFSILSYSVFPQAQSEWGNILLLQSNSDPIMNHTFTLTVNRLATQTILLDLLPNSPKHQVLFAHTAAAWAIDRPGIIVHPDGKSKVLQLKIHRPASVTNGNTTSIKTGAHRNAFTIAHETGHAMLKVMAPSVFYGINPPFDVIDGPCALPNGHQFSSIEVQWVAFNEAFGNFFAAYALNDRTGNDCRISRFNCKDDTGSLNADDVPWMENNCGSNWAGRGSESDWTRTFWNMTVDGVAGPAAAIQFVREADQDTPFTSSDVFGSLDSYAQGLPAFFRNAWNSASDTNGIDH